MNEKEKKRAVPVVVLVVALVVSLLVLVTLVAVIVDRNRNNNMEYYGYDDYDYDELDDAFFQAPSVSNNSRTVIAEQNTNIIAREPLMELKNLDYGTVVTFSGFEWIIISDSENTMGLICKDATDYKIYGQDNIYNLDKIDSLGYYLNNYFINKLNSNLIIENEWNVGEYENETSRTISCKIGLLTKEEYITLVNMDVLKKVDEEKIDSYWLITPSSSDSDVSPDFVCVSTTNRTPYEGWPKAERYVRPVIYVNSNLKVDANNVIVE